MAITIKTIAELANVSTATVSRFFNSPESVSEKKRRVLEKIVEEQHYKPNELARGLIKNTSNMIGVILPDINNIYFSPIMLGVETELEVRGYSTLICNTHGNIEKEKEYIAALRSHKVAGIVFIGTRPDDQSKSKHIIELAEKLPVVLINDYLDNGNVNAVLTNEEKGMAQAVEYLHALGHRHIAFLNSKLPMTTYRYKADGFRMVAEKLGITEQVMYFYGEPYECGGHAAVSQLLDGDLRPTAIVTANDQMAIGAIRAIFEHGMRVPGDISVIGYSNTPISGEIYPRLTTVDQYPFLTGKKSAQLLLQQINDPSPVRGAVNLETKLVIRDSCAAIKDAPKIKK